MRVLVIADSGDSDPGWVGERLQQRGGVLRTVLREEPTAVEAARASVEAGLMDLVLHLGSGHSVYDEQRADLVRAEADVARCARTAEVPALGICFGAQLLAHAHGGAVREAARGEVGRMEVTSYDPVLCPAGPWLQWHSDAFTLPDGARLLGESSAGPQGFWLDAPGPVLAWQFHPETTPVMVRQWLADDAAYVERHGADPAHLVREADATAAAAREAAHALVDGALAALFTH